MQFRWVAMVGAAALAPAFLLSSGAAPQAAAPQTAAAAADWPMHNRDLAATRYSPLKQIDTGNVAKIQLAWSMRLRLTDAPGRGGAGAGGNSEATPIVINGVMYIPVANRVLALDPDTGKEIWRYDLTGGTLSKRGVAYWPGDGATAPRIIATAGATLFALDAKTGERIAAFGQNGAVSLAVPYNSAPTIYKNLVFVGANVGEKQSANANANQAGNTRAFDARTGVKVWEFQSVPKPGETGNETWDGESWKNRTGANHWAFSMTVDAERSVLYTVFGSPASDYYGGDRKGDDLFGNSVVALDADTGKLKWYYQVVHHDQWDYDIPQAPVLLDVAINGQRTPILAQSGKTGYMYILNRVTGKPVFGIEEKPVPISKVPGEFSSPTQPIPVKPPNFGRTSFKAADLVTAADTTEEHAAACRELVVKSGGALYNEGPFTPWVFRPAGAPAVSSVIFPGAIGGSDWGGVSADPTLDYVFINTSDYGSIGWIEKTNDPVAPYDQRSVYGGPVPSKFWDRKTAAGGGLMGESSWPCQKPPWGWLTAVNMKTGEFAWHIPFGVTDTLPEAKQKTGRLNVGGSVATAGGLLFIGATNDRRFRAFESKTGKELWVWKLDYSAMSGPISYQGKNGKQYVAVTASGGVGITDPNPANTEQLYVFALP